MLEDLEREPEAPCEGFNRHDLHVLEDSQNVRNQPERLHSSKVVQEITEYAQLKSPEHMLKTHRNHEDQRFKHFIDSVAQHPAIQQRHGSIHNLLLLETDGPALDVTPPNKQIGQHCNLEMEGDDVCFKEHEGSIDVDEQLIQGWVVGQKCHQQVDSQQDDDDRLGWILREFESESGFEGRILEFMSIDSQVHISYLLYVPDILFMHSHNLSPRDHLECLLWILLTPRPIRSMGIDIIKNIIIEEPMDNLLREKITQLTSKCDVLQKNGKFAECIDIMEEIVSIKKSIYGIQHPEFDKASEKLCEYLNLAAMVELQKQKFEQTLDHLRKAQLVARNSLALKSTTYNNLACYYRRTGKVRTALSYLIQALDLELKIDQPKTLADTHINLCAVLSQLDRHEDALQHSMLSIILLQDEFLTTLLSKYKSGDQGSGDEEINDERLAVLAIAYHNLGVEFEHLKRFDEALKIYNKALKFSKQNLSNNEQLVRNLTRVVNSATEQMEEQKKSLFEQKSGKKLQRELSEAKKDIYKDLSKTVERYRHLPKLKFNTNQYNSRDHASNLQSYEPINQTIDFGYRGSQFNNTKRTSGSLEKGMLTKKIGNQTRFNKGFMDTPESRGQLDSELKVRQGMGTRTNRNPYPEEEEQQQ